MGFLKRLFKKKEMEAPIDTHTVGAQWMITCQSYQEELQKERRKAEFIIWHENNLQLFRTRPALRLAA